MELRPERLCKKCGKCCRVVTASSSHEELLFLSNAGNKSAKDFLDIFEPYSSIDEAKKVAPEIVDNILAKADSKRLNELTLYGCKYLSDDNLCQNYENRPNLCKSFPSNPWAVVPPGCGFEGWLFREKEEIKRVIRKEKEELISLGLLQKEATEEYKQKIQDRIDKIKGHIQALTEYGSNDW